MPRKSDKVSISDEILDRRVKLTSTAKENIIAEYATGEISINGLARKYKVSKRLIQFTLFPERKEKAKQAYLERRKDGRYYDKDKHTKSIREHRDYKKDLWSKGFLKPEE